MVVMKDNNPNLNSQIKKIAAQNKRPNALSRILRLLQVNQKILIFNFFIKSLVPDVH